MAIREKKAPDAVASAGDDALRIRAPRSTHKSGHVRLSWSIPPDARDGLKIYIGQRGHIVLAQTDVSGDESKIILHPDEARILHQLMPATIAAADGFRRTL